MKKILVGLALLLFFSYVQAQDIVVDNLRKEISRSIKKDQDTSKWTWKRGGLASANLTQGSLSNWAGGGDKFTLAVNSYVNGFMFFRKGRQNWDNNLDFFFGLAKTTSLGTRKNDDRIDILSKYGYKITDSNSKFLFTGLFNFRTQFFDGYNYISSTEKDFSSSLLSPAYMLLSAGIDYKPNDKFSMFVSPLTSRTIIVGNNYLSRKGSYGVDSGKHVASELGAFVTLNYATVIAKNVTYRGRVDFFSNYRNKPGNIDMYMTNLIACKINKYLSATYSLDLIYDDDVKIFGPNANGARLQVKSLLGIGLMMMLPVKKT